MVPKIVSITNKINKMSFKRLGIVATENVIMIVFKGKRIQFTRENAEFEKIKELIRNRDEDAIIEKIDKGGMIIPEFSNGLFKIREDEEKIIDIETNTEVSLVLGKRIIQWAKEGFPFEPLLKFHRKLLLNPSTQSAAELYMFLEANMIPITAEGNFIAYKKVTSVGRNLMDSHSKTINNNIGNIVKIPREKVNPDRNQTCSYGLHVGAWDYVKSFSGDTTIEVEVEPQDVVTVPPDYNQQKMRVCRYKVLGISGGEEINRSFVKVKKTEVKDRKTGEVKENKIHAQMDKVDLSTMTASQVKAYIKDKYKTEITIDNKNKQAIIKKAYKIIEEA